MVTKFNAFLSTQSEESKQICACFNDKERIRFLVAAKHKQQQCIEDMKGYIKWKADYLPVMLTDPLAKILVHCLLEIALSYDIWERRVL
jgi:hypothetical protein